MTHVVLSHVLDEAAGVYRVVIAEAVVEEMKLEPVYEVQTRRVETPALGSDGEPLYDVDDDGEPDLSKPIMNVAEVTEYVLAEEQPTPEAETVYVNAEEIVFDASDDRWKASNGRRRKADDVAAEQRAEIKKALAAREAEARKAARAVAQQVELPGVGDAL